MAQHSTRSMQSTHQSGACKLTAMPEMIRIATRRSPLAVWQAEHVAACLRAGHAGLTVELLPLSTTGDKLLDAPLAKVGGKGLFVKEIEQALLDGRADLAVHSMKDVPVDMTPDLHIPVMLSREDPSDAFVSPRYPDFRALPAGARIGTSSLRRKCQLRASRPDLQFPDLRGGVNSRLRKVHDGEYDAIVLASSGLMRLGLESEIKQRFDYQTLLPAVGQGALGVQCRQSDAAMQRLIEPMNDSETRLQVLAERAVNEELHGGCQVPIAAHATCNSEWLTVRGLVARLDGSMILHASAEGPLADAERLGATVADSLVDQGARDILDEIFAAS